MAGDWIKLHRKTLHSLVYSDAGLLHLWIALLLKASWKPSHFMGEAIEPGQVAFSGGNLASELGVNRTTLIRRLKKLKKYGQISIKANSRFTVVTICNWGTYQNQESEGATANATASATTDATAGATASATHSKKVRSKEGKESSSCVTTTTTKRFKKPTVDQVADYIREKNYAVDATHFIDYYEANGWKVGRNAMKDWKAAVRTWQKNEKGSNRGNTNNIGPGQRYDPSSKTEPVRFGF